MVDEQRRSAAEAFGIDPAEYYNAVADAVIAGGGTVPDARGAASSATQRLVREPGPDLAWDWTPGAAEDPA